MNRIILIILVCFSFQVCQATDTDELHEEVLNVFDADWVFVKTKLLYEDSDSWSNLKSEHPQTAYNIAKFWRRKAEIGTIEYNQLLVDKLREEIASSKLTEIEKEKLRFKYRGAMPEAVRCFIYDHAAEIDKMIERALEKEKAISIDSKKTIGRLQELRKMRDDYTPMSVKEMVSLAQKVRAMDDTEGALDVLKRGQALHPNRAPILMEIAECYQQLNKQDKAVEFWKQVSAMSMTESEGLSEVAMSKLKGVKPELK